MYLGSGNYKFVNSVYGEFRGDSNPDAVDIADVGEGNENNNNKYSGLTNCFATYYESSILQADGTSFDEHLIENPTVTYYYSTTNSTTGGTEWKNMTATTLNARTYYIYAVVGDTSNHTGYTTETAVSFQVLKADYDLSGVTFENTSITYDGELHTIGVTGTLPQGVSVKYYVDDTEFSGATQVGTYTIVAKFTGDANHNTIEDKTATLTITEAAPIVDPEVDTDDGTGNKYISLWWLIVLLIITNGILIV